jgi:hypothetical protein
MAAALKMLRKQQNVDHMLLYHPSLALHHVWDGRRKPPTLGKKTFWLSRFFKFLDLCF